MSNAMPADLVPALRQTVGPLFSALDPTLRCGALFPARNRFLLSAPSMKQCSIQSESIASVCAKCFHPEWPNWQAVFHSILSPSTLADLQRIAHLEEADFNYPAELWVRTVYEFAASYHRSVINRDHIIQALGSFVSRKGANFHHRKPKWIRAEMSKIILKPYVWSSSD